jgi:hypothetical protein
MAKRRRNTRPRDTSANRARRGKNKNMMRVGSKNGAWKGGGSAHHYRRKAGAKPGEVVHHKNKNKGDNRRKNLGKLKSLASHNKRHPEKGRKRKRR